MGFNSAFKGLKVISCSKY